LTFTRKAASELGARVRKRLDRLREVLPADELERLGGDALFDGEPMVSTYHSYAARLFGDHALREALEPTMRLISPAVAWQICSRVGDAYGGPMDRVDWQPDPVTKAVMDLAGDLAEHLRTAEDVRKVGRWLDERFAALEKPLKAQRDILDKHAVREQLMPLVEAYGRAQAERGVVDHGDRTALAARTAPRDRAVPVLRRAAGRVPGHQPGAARPAEVAVRGRAPGDGRGRPLPVHLRVAGRQRGEPAAVRARLPAAARRARRAPGARARRPAQ